MTQSAIMNTCVGRYIGGSLTEKRDTDMDDRPIPVDKQQFEIGVAFRKDDPQLPQIFNGIAGHAWTEFARDPAAQQKIGQAAQYFPQYPQVLDGFSWKISDGDKPNRKGQVSEHTRGHYVFYFKSSFPIRCANQQNAEIPADQIKRGYFVDVSFTCAGNGETGDRAGVYLNPAFVRLIAFGEEIRGGVSAAEAFANAPVPTQLPPGASAMPVAGNPAAMPTGAPAAMPQSLPPAGMPANGLPTSSSGPSVPTPAFPSNQPGFPGAPMTPAAGAPAAFPGGSAPSPTGFPGSQPHPTFANGPTA